MKAQHFLQQIRKKDAMINALIEELAYMESLATKTTSSFGERVQASGSQQKMADCVVKIADARNRLNDEIDSFIDFKMEAMRILSGCDSDCAELLHKRYFHGKRWEEIAVEMSFTYQWVSGGLHQKALSQFQKELDQRKGIS